MELSKPKFVEDVVNAYGHLYDLVYLRTHPLVEVLVLDDAIPRSEMAWELHHIMLDVIAELEPERRGVYAGAVGYFSFSGNMDMAIAIRTMVLKDGVAYVQAGCGVVYDSVPEREFQETLSKARALIKATEQAERISGGEDLAAAD